ncbi:unnamed protein product [Cochlearia groenlandica]
MVSDSGEAPIDGGDKTSAENSRKRKLKTPNQVTALEDFYNEHKYPTEEMKAKLVEETGLTEKQVSGWFCHRRLKDKRSVKEDGNNIGSQDRSSVVLQDRGSGLRQDSCGSTKQTDYMNTKPRDVESQRLYGGGSYMGNADGDDSTSSDRSSSLHKNLVSSREVARDVESSRYIATNVAMQRPQVMRSKPSGYLKVKAKVENVAITAVKRQLGRQYQEDGPPLGVEFDPLPPIAFEPQTNVIVQEPIYVGNQRRSHTPYLTGTGKSFNPHSNFGLARKSKIHPPDSHSEDDGDDNMLVGMEPGRRLKSPSLSYSNPVSDHNSLKETFKGSLREIPLINNNKKNWKSSKSGDEALRNNLITNFHNLSGSNTEVNHSHNYDESMFNGGRKTGYLTKSPKLLPLSNSRSTNSIDRDPPSGMAEQYNGERHEKNLHSTNERVKHGYVQQAYAPKSPNYEFLERKSQINRSGLGLPSSFSGDNETEESSSSSMD